MRRAVHLVLASVAAAAMLGTLPSAGAAQPRVVRAAPDVSPTVLASSRAAARRNSSTVTIVFTDSLLPTNVRAMVLRRALAKPQNVIVLRSSDRDAAVLAGAMAHLESSRRELGDELTMDERSSLTSVAIPDGVNARAFSAAADGRMKHALASARMQHVEGLGHVRAITLPVGPVKHPRSATSR